MNDGLKEKYRQAVIDILSAHPEVKRAVLFGSRAIETFTTTSDVDIALFGKNLTQTDQTRLAERIDELSIPKRIDLLLHKTITNKNLLSHISTHGVEWYDRNSMAGQWQHEKLQTVATVRSGFSFKSKDMGDIGCPIIKIKNIIPSSVNITDVKRVPFHVIETNKQVNNFLLSGGDILIAMTGATLGKVGRMPKTRENYYLNQRVGKVFLHSPEKIDYDFLYYVLSQETYVRQMFVIADGSVQANISSGQIESLDIPLPPLSEQRTIAHILGSLDDKIELNRQMNETLEAMTETLFYQWFVEEKEYYWKESTLSHYCDVIDCLHSKKPNETRQQQSNRFLLQVYNIGDQGKIDLSSKYYVDNDDYQKWTNRISLSGGEIIISKTGRVAAMAQIPRGLTAGIGRNLVAIRIKEKFTAEYLRDLMLSKWMKRKIRTSTSDGTILQSLHVKSIAALPTINPPRQKIEEYTSIVSPIHSKINNNIFSIMKLENLRDTLLPKLISGELRLTEIARFMKKER